LPYQSAADTTTLLDPNKTTTAKYLRMVGTGTNGAAPTWGQVAFSELSGNATAAQGGTGQTSYAVGDLLYASSTSALSRLADTAIGNVLISGGTNTAPSWGKVGLTTHVSGVLAVGNGGTGATTLTSTGILIGNGTNAISAPGPTLSATTMTFGGAGTINSTTTSALTLDSTSTGAIYIGTNANAKIITIGNTTGATAVDIKTGTGNLDITSPLTTMSGNLSVGSTSST